MKKISKISMVMIFLGSLLGLVNTVSAKAIGADYSMFGIELGWCLIIIGIIVLIIGAVFLSKKVASKLGVPMVAIILIGAFISFAQVADVPVAVTDQIVDGWTISGKDSACGTCTATWDDTNDPKIFTVQVNHDLHGADINTFDELTFEVNFTANPIAGAGADTTKLVTIHYKTDYTMEYEGEPVLEKSGNNYIANTSNEDQEYTFYEGTMDMTLDETNWFRFFYEFDADGNTTIGEVFATVGESMSWTITVWDDYGWTDTFTVMCVVITTD